MCEVGQKTNVPCQYYETKSNFLGKKDNPNRARAIKFEDYT